jgi:hypothetical protein
MPMPNLGLTILGIYPPTNLSSCRCNCAECYNGLQDKVSGQTIDAVYAGQGSLGPCENPQGDCYPSFSPGCVWLGALDFVGSDCTQNAGCTFVFPRECVASDTSICNSVFYDAQTDDCGSVSGSWCIDNVRVTLAFTSGGCDPDNDCLCVFSLSINVFIDMTWCNATGPQQPSIQGNYGLGWTVVDVGPVSSPANYCAEIRQALSGQHTLGGVGGSASMDVEVG